VALWGLPPFVLLVGAAVILMDLRRRRTAQAEEAKASLTPAEEARLQKLLGDGSTS
jgi:cytochrome c-type biogenesis protein CcmH/NrfF